MAVLAGKRAEAESVIIPFPAARFWAKVRKKSPDECWEWQGKRRADGYGTLLRRSVRAHRVAWELTNGPIPPALDVCHKCDNPGCVNPSHLFVGTAKDNLQDASAKGRLKGRRVLRGSSHGMAKLNEINVHEVRRLHMQGWSFTKIGAFFRISPATAHRAATGRSWRHLE